MTNTRTTAPVDETAQVHARTGRPASVVQGALLLAVSALPTLGTVLVSPVLPRIGEVFASDPAASFLVPLIATAPALLIAVLSPFAGVVVDRFSRKNVLIASLLAYAILGVAPAILEGLTPIVISRVALGAAEAFIITCCTAIIADYFLGAKRIRYLSLQAFVTTVAATAFLAIGGSLGDLSWRAPFWVYGIAIALAVLCVPLIWRSAPRKSDSVAVAVVAEPPFRIRVLAFPMLFSWIGAVLLLVPIVQLPYLLSALGTTAPGIIGSIAAIVSLTSAAGAIAYPLLARKVSGSRLRTMAFLIAGGGLAATSLTSSVEGVSAAMAFASFGTGMLLPSLVTWALQLVPAHSRGRGIGFWWSSIYVGHFTSPLIIVALTGITHSLPSAITIVGVLGIVAGLTVALAHRAWR